MRTSFLDQHRQDRRDWATRFGVSLVAALLLHVGVLYVLGLVVPLLMPDTNQRNPPLLLTILQPPPEETAEPEEPRVKDLEGQLIEISPPEVEEVPEEAEYLSDHDIVVEKETRSDKVKVNPDVLARVFSKESKLEREDLLDLNIDKPSTGAQVGNDRFDPDRDGTLASLPSPWAVTNKDGMQDPVPSAHLSSTVAGAPQNDLIKEERGDMLSVNSKKYLFNGYIQRIRRLVNFYWQQNLDNLGGSVRLGRSSYVTKVNVILDGDGFLEYIEVTRESGSPELDHAVVSAFKIAGPYPNPPEGLIEKDGRVYLPDFDFTVNVGLARAHYQGIDPRAGVQFPGILKSPR